MAARKKASKPTLLSGGNPQIPLGYGDKSVKAWLAAVPGWKKAVARRVDELISRAIPDVSKAVKYNSPLYGLDGKTWFLSLHCYDRYLKVTFFRGAQLEPVPAVTSKMPHVRYFHLHETDDFDQRLFTDWVKQASRLPGEKL
ncbi:MAG: DUF1801 domain-containing protein [Nibricoccus sp.]